MYQSYTNDIQFQSIILKILLPYCNLKVVIQPQGLLNSYILLYVMVFFQVFS